MVSPGGCCFLDVTELGEHLDSGVHYLRLNDLYCWSRHGVYLARTGTWQRLELKYTTLSKHKKISKSPMASGGAISKEKFEELKRMLNEKKEELKKVTMEMEDEIQKLRDENDEELQKVQQEMEAAIDKRDAELRKAKKDKGEELRKLRKEKDEEIRKLRREMHDEVERLEREKDEEAAKLEKEKAEETLNHQPAKKEEEELKMLRRREAAELQRRTEEKDEELRKLRGELEDLRRKKKDEDEEDAGDHKLEKEKENSKDKEALQQLVREKDVTLQELGKLRDQLLGELEQRRKNSWRALSFVRPCFDYRKLRKQVPREKFERYNITDTDSQYQCHRYAPHTRTCSAFPRRFIQVVDEESADDWPAPPRVGFMVSQGGQFDVDNWWFMKTSHPEGGSTMLAFYGGSLSCGQDVPFTCNTCLPYPRGCDFYADTNFFLANVDSGWVLAFTYRE